MMIRNISILHNVHAYIEDSESLGDYPLRSVTRIYNSQNFNRHRACWYDVFEADPSRVNLSNANLSVEPV